MSNNSQSILTRRQDAVMSATSKLLHFFQWMWLERNSEQTFVNPPPPSSNFCQNASCNAGYWFCSKGERSAHTLHWLYFMPVSHNWFSSNLVAFPTNSQYESGVVQTRPQWNVNISSMSQLAELETAVWNGETVNTAQLWHHVIMLTYP